MCRKFLLFTLLFCTITVKLFSQTTASATISGTVVDAQTKETIPFATALLLNRATKARVKIAQSDVNGVFTVVGVPKGVYTFKVSYVGYQTMVRDSLSINVDGQKVKLGTVQMKPSKTNVLKEVTVAATKPTMQMGIDKKVFSVESSLVSEGGSATDLLQNVPSVQLDMDGNVSLRGSTGVRVLIDGKPSLIAGGDVAQILQSIPANSIESVELITNPSAKYDAEGQSGIINIVLKKNKKLGLNGSATVGVGNRENYNAGVSLAFQNKKLNLYGNYNYRYGYRLGGGYANTTYFNQPSGLGYTFQDRDSRDLDQSHSGKVGVDYYVAEKTQLSFSAGLNNRVEDERDLLAVRQLTTNYDLIEQSNRLNTEDGNGSSYDLNFDLAQKFNKKGEELTANFSHAWGNNDGFQIYDTDILFGTSANGITRTDRLSNNRNYIAQVDYTLPLGQFGKMEAGYRSQIRVSETNTYADQLSVVTPNTYDFNYTLSNLFNNKDQVHALYLNYQNQVGNFGYQVGLRGEDARLDTRLGAYDINSNVNYTPGRVAYTRLYPSVFLTQKLNGEQQLQASYTRRVNRPRGWDTNPFLDVSDPYNYRQGNPNLLPEDVHAFELSYSKFWKKVTFISSLYLRKTNDLIQRIRTEPDANGVTTSIPQNLTSSVNSGLELIGKFDVLKWWNFTANVNLYQRHLDGVPQYSIAQSDGFSYNGNLTNDFKLPGNFSVQLRGEYNSREIQSQGVRKANYSVDGGAKYEFAKRKASLSFNIRDIFNSRRFYIDNNTPGSYADFSFYRKGRQANLTLSYRFGKTDFQFKKAKKPAQQEDQGGGEGQF